MFGLALLSNFFFTGEWLTRFNEVFNERWSWRQTLVTGLLAAGFLAIDYVHIHFSRIIFGPVTTLLLLMRIMQILMIDGGTKPHQ